MQDSDNAFDDTLKALSRERLTACESMERDTGRRLVSSQDAIRRARDLLERTRGLVRRR